MPTPDSGSGFAHSEDDFATIQDVALATRGTLAASEGVKAAPGDYLAAPCGFGRLSTPVYERDLPADVKLSFKGLCRRSKLFRGAASRSREAGAVLAARGHPVFVF